MPYIAWMGFTHVELMPVMEHPLDESWGYQPIGLHAPTARMGDPDGLKRFIAACHAAGLGVLLWLLFWLNRFLSDQPSRTQRRWRVLTTRLFGRDPPPR